MGKPVDYQWSDAEWRIYKVITDAVDAIQTFNCTLDYELNTDEHGHPLNSISFEWPISDVQNFAAMVWGHTMRDEFLG